MFRECVEPPLDHPRTLRYRIRRSSDRVRNVQGGIDENGNADKGHRHSVGGVDRRLFPRTLIYPPDRSPHLHAESEQATSPTGYTPTP